MKYLKTLTAAVFATTVAGTAMAQAKPEPDYTLAFNAAVATDYRFRGLSQSRFDPAVSGGVDFTHKSGFYIGAWASTIKWVSDAHRIAGSTGGGDVEVDIYGGYRGSVGDVGYDLGVLNYIYPGNDFKSIGGVSPNTTEVYAGLTFGPVTAKYSHTVTNAFGWTSSKNSGYLDLSATFDLGSGWSLVPHVGHQKIDGPNSTNGSYTDYSLTVNKDFGNGFVVSLAAIGSDAKLAGYATPSGKKLGRDTAVLTLKYNF